jgi:hypothetical protein
MHADDFTNIRYIVLLALCERNLPLSSKRLLWYCHWFHYAISRQTLYRVLHDMKRRKQVMDYKEGNEKFWTPTLHGIEVFDTWPDLT